MKDLLPYNKNLKNFSRQLRSNMTDVEKLLWAKIRGKQLKGCQFYRQKVLGNYIVDFFCPKAQLVVELDGGPHYSEEGLVSDAARDAYLQGLGLNILRFSDREVLDNLEGVLEMIYRRL
jgi:very-short-patch-repair endonuclease